MFKQASTAKATEFFFFFFFFFFFGLFCFFRNINKLDSVINEWNFNKMSNVINLLVYESIYGHKKMQNAEYNPS